MPYTSRIAFMLIVVAGFAHAAVIPYTEDFNDNTADDFSPLAEYSVNSQAYDINAGGSTSAGVLLPSTVQITNAAGGPFTIAGTFSTAQLSKGKLGFAALGNDSGLSSSYYVAYLVGDAVVAQTDRLGLELAEIGGDGQINASYTPATPYDLTGESFTVALKANYDEGGVLSLQMRVRGDGFDQTLNATDTTPLTGEYFGYAAIKSGGPLDATVDDFIMEVPEPGTIAVLLLGVTLGARHLRRRRND